MHFAILYVTPSRWNICVIEKPVEIDDSTCSINFFFLSSLEKKKKEKKKLLYPCVFLAFLFIFFINLPLAILLSDDLNQFGPQ